MRRAPVCAGRREQEDSTAYGIARAFLLSATLDDLERARRIQTGPIVSIGNKAERF